jgi:hypothetical protein
LDEGDGTALSPECGIDSVIGSASGYPVTLDFLRRMQEHWFATSVDLSRVEKNGS